MVVGKRFDLLRLIQTLRAPILSRDPCPCQSILEGWYQDGILFLFAGSVKQLAAAWMTILLQFGHIALVPWSRQLLPPLSPPMTPLPLLLPLPFPLAIAARRAEFFFMMSSICLRWASSSVRSRAAGSGLSRVGVPSLATYSRAAASDPQGS